MKLVLPLLVAASASLGLAVVASHDPQSPERSVEQRPIQVPDEGYASSETCRACHPEQYATWHSSYHRTMTQVAAPETVRASFDNTTIREVHGRPMRLERTGSRIIGPCGRHRSRAGRDCESNLWSRSHEENVECQMSKEYRKPKHQ